MTRPAAAAGSAGRRRPASSPEDAPCAALLDGYYRLLKLLLTVLMAALIVPVTMQILSRYTGIIPRYIWTEEIARFCFVWIIMIGSMIAVRDGTHFDVDVLPRSADRRGRARPSACSSQRSRSWRGADLPLVWLGLRHPGLAPAIRDLRAADAVDLHRLAARRRDLGVFVAERIWDAVAALSPRGSTMGPGEVAAILFGTFAVLVFLRVPVAFALALAVVPVFFIEDRLTPSCCCARCSRATTPSSCWPCRSSCWRRT